MPLYVFGVVLAGLAGPDTGRAEDPLPLAGPEQVLTPQPVPETPEAITEVRSLIEADLRGTTTRPVEASEAGPSPEVQSALNGEKARLRQTLTDYQQALESYGQTLAAIEEVKGRASREQVEAQITRLQEQAGQYRQAIEQEKASPRFHSRDEFDRVEVESERIRTQRDALAASQTKRDQELDQFEARIREAATVLKEAEAALDAFRTTPTTQPASQPAEESARQEWREVQERRLVWSVALAQLRLAALRQQRAQLQLEFDRDGRLLAALGDYAEQLEGFRSLIQQSATELERKRIQQKIKLAKTDTARLYWQAREEILEARTSLRQQVEEIRRRYPQSTLNTLKTDVGRSVKSWNRFVEGLERHESQVKQTRYRELQAEIRKYVDRRSTLGKRLGESDRDAAEILRLQDNVLGEIDRIVNRMTAEIGKMENASDRVDASKLRDELTTDHLPELREALDEAETQADETIAFLTEAIRICDEHLTRLAATSDALYWSHVLASDGGWFSADFRQLKTEWDTLPALWRGTAEDRSDAARLAGVKDRVANWVNELPRERTAIVLAMALASGILAYVYRGKAVRWADARVGPLTADMKERQAAFAPLTDRLLLQAAWVGSGAAVWLVPVLVLLIVVEMLPADPLGARLAASALWYILLGGLSLALVRFAFGGEKARFRILPCSNTVAAYYRWWLRALVGFLLLTVPFTLFLYTVDVLPELRHYAVGLTRGFATLIVLLFLRNRQTVVRVVGRIRNVRYQRLYSALVSLYPLGFALVLVLFVLRTLGYTALADFVILNMSQTLAALLIAVLLTRVVRDVTERLARPREAEEGPGPSPDGGGSIPEEEGLEVGRLLDRTQVARVLGTLARWTIALGAVVWVARAWGIGLYRLQRILGYALPLGGDRRIAISRLILAVAVIVISFYVSRAVRRQLHKRVFPAYLADDRGAQAAVSTMVHYAIILLGLYYALVTVGVTLGALVVLLGGLGLGLGLGLQPVIVNFISGLLILFERHIKVGDIVEASGQLGEVVRISMRSTSIKTFDNVDIVIPNGDFINAAVINWSLHERLIRGKVEVGVAYGSNTDLVRDLLLRAARDNAKVLDDPPPAVWFLAFGDSSLNFTLVCWFSNTADRWAGMTELRYEIDRLFRENDIEIPFPQRTLTVKGGTPIPVRLITEEAGRSAEALPTPRPTPSRSSQAPAGRPPDADTDDAGENNT